MQAINVVPGVPNTPVHAFDCFMEVSANFYERNYTINGVTKDAGGTALGLCTVYLFCMSSGVPVLTLTTISDVNGNYSFVVDKTLVWWVVSYLIGTPDVVGATVNNLVGV